MKILTILGLIAVAFVAMLGSLTWVVVDVDEHDPDGVHVFIPAPLALADIAVRFVPEARKPIIDVDLEPEYVPLIQAAVAEIRNAGDFEMVRVEETNETVVVRVEAEMLHVAVDTSDERVRVRVPLHSIVAAVDAIDKEGQIRPVDMLAALDDLPSGRLVEVHDSDTDVTISIW